jgi:hypothetical protein
MYNVLSNLHCPAGYTLEFPVIAVPDDLFGSYAGWVFLADEAPTEREEITINALIDGEPSKVMIARVQVLSIGSDPPFTIMAQLITS